MLIENVYLSGAPSQNLLGKEGTCQYDPQVPTEAKLPSLESAYL